MGWDKMPYLICDSCEGLYELEDGESPENFDLRCDCGGKLDYYATKYDYYKEHQKSDSVQQTSGNSSGKNINPSGGFFDNLDTQSKGLIGVGVFGLIIIVLFATGISSSMNPSYADLLPPEVQAANAPILVELYAPRCSACQKFDSETMINPDVQAKLSGYSVMKINVDTDPERASRFNSNIIPTLVILDPKGKEIRRYVGYMAPDEFLKFLKK
jgi:hypothetical protein